MPARPGPRKLDRRSSDPLWSQLRDDLLRRLEGGEFADRFPGEMELVQVYSVSRHTVREALRRLRQDGLIESSRGRSSVAHPGVISQQLGAMYSLFQELESRGIEQRSELIVADRRTDDLAAQRLGLPARTRLVYLERLRLGGDEPIAWDRAWLEPTLALPLLKRDFAHTGLYDEWQRTAGVRLTGGRERISAVVPSKEQRALLGMKRQEAAMLVERTGCLDERPVEFRITLVRGSRFSFAAEWESGRTYQVDVAGAY
ncbi:GntR family transcriptional regulator [Nocardioides sp.]|uniref:GntR family transcriptional regulator n=1 Tax=Nocardioides sp. TaxID=35761 RepID=UPI0035276199